MRNHKKLYKYLWLNLLLVFVLPVVLISVGFSALSTSLSINGIAMFKPVGMILVMSNEPNDSTLVNNISYSHTHETINISANLPTTNDKVIYDVTIRNLGQTNKILSEIISEEFTNDDVKYTLSGLSIGDVFLPGQAITFSVTFKYKNGVNNPSNTRINAILKFMFDDYELPPLNNGYFIPYDGADNFMGFDKSTIKDFIRNKSLTLDEVLEISGVQKISNVSNDQYNSMADIYGWVDSDGVFNWWSEAETVYFHPNTLHAFKDMSELLNVSLEDISTEKVENFSHWFDADRKLVHIKGKINTSGLKLQYNDSFDYAGDGNEGPTSGYGLAFMFNDCNALVSIDLSQFNTTNASDMKRMFAGCTSLTEIDVSGFDTSNVRSMYWMFRKGYKITDVDLSSFDTSNVENMAGMFTAATGVKTVTFGENFDTTKVHNYSNMFNGATALTTINARCDFNIASDAIASRVFYSNSKLVGAKGTSYATNYSSSHTNGEYARIALDGTPGYFTLSDEIMKYIINYNYNGGTATNPSAYYVTTPTFTLNNPVKDGYTFVGWTGSNGETPESSVTITQGTLGNKHYEANYNPNAYIIQFDANGGNGSMSFQDCVYDELTQLNANTYTKDGFVFAGWNSKSDGTGVNYNNTQNIINLTTSGTVTLYAQWISEADKFPKVFNLTGPCYITGPGTNVSGNNCLQYFNSDYIDTGIALFNSDNKDKDFEISFEIVHYVTSEQTESQATIINSKYENSSVSYPGFVLRRKNNNLELTARFNTLTPYESIAASELTKVKIARKDGILYYSFNDNPYDVYQDTTSYTGTFNTTVTFGASINGNGSPMRYAKKLELSNIYIKLGKMEELNN